MKKIKILDCTLRDGGYYTNWDFDKSLTDLYFKSLNKLPIDYIEVGYRNPIMDGYFGEYFFCSSETLQYIKSVSNKKLAIILNGKDISLNNIAELLDPCKGIIDLIRIAINPLHFKEVLIVAKEIKKMGYKVAFNVMYMSKWNEYPELISSLSQLDGLVEYFYLVDSYGGVYPNDVKETIELVKDKTSVPIGFHGHNNLELGLINTLTAIEAGANIIDSTILGMGRGAGNLKTELLLTVLNKKTNLKVDFNALSDITSEIQKLKDFYKWGTSLPYMVSGANSHPQKQVMDWITKKYYSINSIIRALSNKTEGKEDNKKFNEFNETKKYKKAIIIGGGNTAKLHKNAIIRYASNNIEDVCIIHASSKNATLYKDLKNKQFYCLVGNEGVRLEKNFKSFKSFNGRCILPPFPRKMGTYVPLNLEDKTTELSTISFTNIVDDSHTAIALQTAIELQVKEVYLAGYDGYTGNSIKEKDNDLFNENILLFDDAIKNNLACTSITPTKYPNIKKISVYQLIDKNTTSKK